MSSKHNNYILKWAKKLKAVTYLGGQCVQCFDKDIRILQFHHRQKEQKEFSIGKACNDNCRWSYILEELDKCILMCANCHFEYHCDGEAIDKRRIMLKDKLLEYKGVNFCEKCGCKPRTVNCLHFHHLVPRDKSFSLDMEAWKNKKFKSYCIEDRIAKELDKCIVVCANCHIRGHIDNDRFEKFYSQIEQKAQSYKEGAKIDKAVVRQMYEQGMKQIEIARQLNCANSSISEIINNKLPY